MAATGNPYLLIWDSETTGNNVRKDEVIQIGGFLTDFDLNPIFGFNRYCYVSGDIHPAAEQIHGVDKKKLYDWSGGKFLEDVLEEIVFDGRQIFKLPNVVSITYNHSFDKGILNNSLTMQGLRPVDFGTRIGFLRRFMRPGRYNLCAMQLMRSVYSYSYNPSQEVILRTRLGLKPEDLIPAFKKLTQPLAYTVKSEKLHDALFDSFTTLYILRANKGLIYA